MDATGRRLHGERQSSARETVNDKLKSIDGQPTRAARLAYTDLLLPRVAAETFTFNPAVRTRGSSSAARRGRPRFSDGVISSGDTRRRKRFPVRTASGVSIAELPVGTTFSVPAHTR